MNDVFLLVFSVPVMMVCMAIMGIFLAGCLLIIEVMGRLVYAMWLHAKKWIKEKRNRHISMDGRCSSGCQG